MTKVEKHCDNPECDNMMTTTQARLDRGRGKCCSTECVSAMKSARMRGHRLNPRTNPSKFLDPISNTMFEDDFSISEVKSLKTLQGKLDYEVDLEYEVQGDDDGYAELNFD